MSPTEEHWDRHLNELHQKLINLSEELRDLENSLISNSQFYRARS